MPQRKLFSVILLIGDVILWYSALLITLGIRYQTLNIERFWQIHKMPFTIVFILWALLFYIVGLYDWRAYIFNRRTQEKLFQGVALAGAIALTLFYLVPAFGIAPKTNLLIHLLISAGLLVLWRRLMSNFISRASRIPTLFIGFSAETKELIELFTNNMHLGYEASIVMTENQPQSPLPITHFLIDHQLPKIVREHKIGLVVAGSNIKSNKDFVQMLYGIFPTGVGFVDMAGFYENIIGKIPLSLISEVWFLENIAGAQKRIFKFFKRSFDVISAIPLGLLTLSLSPFIALAIKLESSGPILFRQGRVGEQGKTFTLIKFRTMITDAERNGAQWATENDHRVTRIGKILRKTRLDELPQIWNILKGDMSFIGPRPERPEFIENLKKEIPFYDMRHLIQPGLSGWAQINFPYGSSVKDAMEKLQYDLYYIKNRSVILDLSIALKTLAVMFSQKGR